MTTPNLGMTVPVPVITPGPAYAIQISADLNTIDAHDHSATKGAPIPLMSDGGLKEDTSQALGIKLDGTSLTLSSSGLKVTSSGGGIIIPGHTITYGTSAPIADTWVQGDIVFNSLSAPGGNVGWSCVSSGTPGIWREFGLISL